MNIQLIGDKILARIIDQDKTDGGLHLPQIAQRHDNRLAIVAAVGQGRRTKEGFVNPGITAGQKVVLDFGGTWQRIDGELFAVVKTDNLLAVLE